MKRILYIVAIGGAAMMLAQCSPKPRASMSSSATTPAAKVSEVKSKFGDEDIAVGKTLFESKCDRCHGLKQPETRTVEKWEKVLPRMVNFAKLSDTEAGQVRAYILSHAKVE